MVGLGWWVYIHISEILKVYSSLDTGWEIMLTEVASENRNIHKSNDGRETSLEFLKQSLNSKYI